MQNLLLDMYGRLRGHFGFLRWWPGDGPFEIIVGAILTQNTAWKNVERAIENLKAAGVLDPKALYALSVGRLASLVKPAGYYNVKAGRLMSFMDFFQERYSLDVGRMRRTRLPELRKELLGVKGIGSETADSILLYAMGKLTFVVDAYTRRVLLRHCPPPSLGAGFMEKNADYEEIKGFFENNLPSKRGLYKDFHAQIVYVGKDFCRPRPKCAGCPLFGWHGPVEVGKKKSNIC